ncbi:uncharacterized protein BDV17DRAFT_233956 [Aspergillus undulatus]|uniref:uncharacterized protein n=1 Tax=Aspergillus undulatus TaxID=1810928 RepID=UPI003CCD4F11
MVTRRFHQRQQRIPRISQPTLHRTVELATSHTATSSPTLDSHTNQPTVEPVRQADTTSNASTRTSIGAEPANIPVDGTHRIDSSRAIRPLAEGKRYFKVRKPFKSSSSRCAGGAEIAPQESSLDAEERKFGAGGYAIPSWIWFAIQARKDREDRKGDPA